MEQIRLDLIPNGVMPNVHASQFDHGRTIRFNLYEGESPFSLLATDYVKVACNNNISVSTANVGNSHDWTIPDSVAADSGVFIGELTIERDSVIVGSKNFVLNVEEDAYNGKNLEERTASGTIANFETNLQDNLTACKCEINALQSGTGTPSPNNPRPISGFNGCDISHTGKNFLNGDVFADNLAGAAGYSKDTDNKTVKFTNSTTPPYHQVIFEVPFKANTQYTFIFNYTAVAPNRSIRIGYTDGTNSEVFFDTNGSKTSVVVNSLSGKTVKDLYLSFFSNGSTTIYYEEIGIFEGVVTLADFEPYNGQTATVNFGQTVYGGVLDVTNGKITNKYVAVKISDMTWTASGDFFYSALPFKKYGNTNFLCECLRVVDVASVSAMVNGDIKGHPSNTNMYIKNTDWASATDLYNAIGNYYIVYELATPTEITLTPKQIEAIVGINNVFHDCNGQTEVKYLVEV